MWAPGLWELPFCLPRHSHRPPALGTLPAAPPSAHAPQPTEPHSPPTLPPTTPPLHPAPLTSVERAKGDGEGSSGLRMESPMGLPEKAISRHPSVHPQQLTTMLYSPTCRAKHRKPSHCMANFKACLDAPTTCGRALAGTSLIRRHFEWTSGGTLASASTLKIRLCQRDMHCKRHPPVKLSFCDWPLLGHIHAVTPRFPAITDRISRAH